MDLTLELQHDEQSFILALVRKERWAQKELYEEFYQPMMGVCLRYATDDNEALDILHEGFIKVFKSIKKYKPGTSLKAWIKRIMINTAIDYYRKNVRRRTETIDIAQQVPNNDPNAISMMGEAEILVAIQGLSDAYRTIFNLYVIEGFSHKEIAERLGITESTSRSNLVKARNKLKEVLGEKTVLNGE